jgi:hypothetical protein
VVAVVLDEELLEYIGAGVVFEDFVYVVGETTTEELVLDVVDVLVKPAGVEEVVMTGIVFVFVFVDVKV